MKAHSISTDNADLHGKIYLRRLAIQKLNKVNVLDLFAGNNEIWSHIQTDRYYGVEKEKGKGRNIYAENLKLIPSLDLSQFNVIDCDSYGIPFNQIYSIYQNKSLQPGTVIVFTMITNKMSSTNKECLKYFNLSKLSRKAPTLINGLNEKLFYEFLRQKGIKHVFQYELEGQTFVKKYGYFYVEDR